MDVLVQARMWALRNPGLVWGTAVFGAVVTYQVFKYMRKGQPPDQTQERIRRRNVERFERDRDQLEQAQANFFFEGDFTEALQLLAHQMCVLLIVVENRGNDPVTPLSKVWANATVQSLTCNSPTQPGSVVPVHVSPDSSDGRFLQ